MSFYLIVYPAKNYHFLFCTRKWWEQKLILFFNDHLSNFPQITNWKQEYSWLIHISNIVNKSMWLHFFREHVKSLFIYVQLICIFAYSLASSRSSSCRRVSVVSEVTNLATIHICIWNVISFSESQCKICSNAAYSSSDSIVAVPIVFPAKSLTAYWIIVS